MSAGIFRPIMPHQAVATLLLIENSRSMANVWANLRDHYLQRLVETLEMSHPPVPTTMFVLPSLPPTDDQSFYSAVPRQSNGLHDGLRDFRFNYDVNNRLTPARISTGIDFLASTKFQGQAAALHLVIVAATAPSEDTDGLDFGLPPHGLSVWNLLAEKLTQADILCHIVLPSSQDMRSLTSMFDETIRLQKNVEVAPWFPTNQENYIIRLSARPGHQGYSHPVPYNPPRPQGQAATSIPRNHSFPPDNTIANAIMLPDQPPTTLALKADSSPSPSLVSQLQQVHGLTKKKVYGAKPARQPFFRDERPPASLPVPLPLPLSSMPVPDLSPTTTSPHQRDGRAPSHSRVDRLMRLSQGSPTDQYLRLQGRWPRRGSRLSSPEGDVLPSPGSLSSLSEMSSATSYFPSNVPSPISPSSTIDDVYQVPPVVHTTSPGLLMPGDGGVIPEPPWLQQQHRQVSSEVATYATPHQARPHLPNHNGTIGADQQLYPIASTMHSGPYNYAMNTITSAPAPYEPVRPILPSTEHQIARSLNSNPTSSSSSSSRQPASFATSPGPPLSATQPASVTKSSPPKSQKKSAPATSIALDLSLESLPPLSPEDGDKPFFIFEQEPETTQAQAPTALFNDTVNSRDSPPLQSIDSQLRDYSSTAFQEAEPRQPFTSHQLVQPAPFYDSAGYYTAADYSEQFIRDMTYYAPYAQPVMTKTTSSLTGWAG